MVVPITPTTTRDLADVRPGSLPLVVVGVLPTDTPGSADVVAAPPAFDVVVGEGDASLEAILAGVEANPVAATSLTVLLRGIETLSVDHGLAAESAVYSLLQSGAEFAAWKQGSTRTPAGPDAEPAVLAERDGDVLCIVLNRPARHNAFSRSMRDALSEQLALAVADDTIATVEISGNGPSFCSGGDLGEFGSFSDPARAHVTRLARSPARLLHRVAAKSHVHLHGACMGAGIELAAFAGRVSAHPQTLIALPEVSLGLIPGAGGTVSVTRRVGRRRCAHLALLGGPIDATTALGWGLIDSIEADPAGTAAR